MALVAIAMVAIIAIAALSIDVVTLYLAREEAQRTADAAALTAARVISLSGMTGDPANSALSWQAICGGGLGVATQAATAVARQSTVGGAIATNVTVTYAAAGNSDPNCSNLPAAFAVNPLVTVTVQRVSLPTFFSRIWARSGSTGNSVSATATAEAFNPSNSGNVGNQGATGTIIPVQPRCVKPWVIPNLDPLTPAPSSGGYCDQGGGACQPLISTTDGSIQNKGISLNGANTTGIIGERFWLAPDCIHTGGSCSLRTQSPVGNYYDPSRRMWLEPPPSLQYLPGDMSSASSVAVPSCSLGSAYRRAVGGCDQGTVYQCGVQNSSASNPNQIDLSENPGWGTGDTASGVSCMIHEGDPTDTQPDGQDQLDPYGAPRIYPFQILAGTSNPLVPANTPVTSSPSIVSLPIYDQLAAGNITTTTKPVTIIGFLQVFINSVDQWGIVDVTILNVVGCGDGTTTTGSPVTGTSPVPVRLVTPP
jgi:hypothetical protein